MTDEEITRSSRVLGLLFQALPMISTLHAPNNALYALLSDLAKASSQVLYGPKGPQRADFGPFGNIEFPYHQMGTITSVDLFGIDELIIFSFYWRNRERYRNVADIGANIGLHSVLLARCGFNVRSFEPDPRHHAVLQAMLERNGANSVVGHLAAVSTSDGESEFIRVLGNTTGSHLAGAKAAPYGALDTFTVRTEAFAPVLAWADLVKMDVEGHEKTLLLSTSGKSWLGKDAIAEIGSPENAVAIYEHFSRERVAMFAQKTGWGRVVSPRDMPTSYRDGSLFISGSGRDPWL